MAFVMANGIRLHVQRLPEHDPAASRPVVVLVHGLADSLAGFYFTLTGPLTDAGFDVISYDLRGHGRSEQPPNGYTVLDAVDDLTGLLAALDIDTPVHLVGYSYGGTIAFSFAHHHPHRVASIVLIEGEPPTPEWAARMVDGLRRAAAHIADEEYLAAQPDILIRAAVKGRALDVQTSVRQDLTAPEALLEQDEVRAVGHPKLVIFGEESELCGLRVQLLPLLSDCRTEIIPGQDHLLLVHAPNELRDLLVPWLAEQAVR